MQDWQEPRDSRSWLALRCADFQLVWDVADCHKHMRFRDSRRERHLAFTEGAFDHKAFDHMAFDTDNLAIVFTDGGGARVPDVFHSVAEMWRKFLDEWAL